MTRRPQRVGLLVPSSNTVMEPDFWRMLPNEVTVHAGRMYLEETTPGGESRMLDEFALPAARDVATVHPDVIVFGCTSAGALRGNDHDSQLCQRISELSGVSTVSVIASVRQAIAAVGACRAGVVTPYVDALNIKIAKSLEAYGVEVVKIAGLGIADNVKISEVPPERIVEFAVDELSGLAIDLVFASCTNFRAVEAIPELEARFQLPVITSNQATLAVVREMMSAASPAAGP